MSIFQAQNIGVSDSDQETFDNSQEIANWPEDRFIRIQAELMERVDNSIRIVGCEECETKDKIIKSLRNSNQSMIEDKNEQTRITNQKIKKMEDDIKNKNDTIGGMTQQIQQFHQTIQMQHKSLENNLSCFDNHIKQMNMVKQTCEQHIKEMFVILKQKDQKIFKLERNIQRIITDKQKQEQKNEQKNTILEQKVRKLEQNEERLHEERQNFLKIIQKISVQKGKESYKVTLANDENKRMKQKIKMYQTMQDPFCTFRKMVFYKTKSAQIRKSQQN